MRDYLLEVEAAIRGRPTSDKKTYYLCAGKRKLLCLPQSKVKDRHVFRKYSGLECDEGLTAGEWGKLDNRLRDYFGKGQHETAIKDNIQP